MALGQNLIKKKIITLEQLEKALAEQKKNPNERIGQIMIRLGFATREQVNSNL
jgi:hypothetical protein